MIAEFHRRKAWQGECEVYPDRIGALDALFLGSVARGRTLLEKFPATPSVLAFENFLRQCGIELVREGDQVRIEGKGLRGLRPLPIQDIPLDEHGELLRQVLLSQDTDTEFRFTQAISEEPIQAIAKEGISIQFGDSTAESFTLRHFASAPTFPKADSDGWISPSRRMGHLWHHLVEGTATAWEERLVLADGFARQCQFFGAPLRIGLSDEEQLSELERRLARASGRKSERRVEFQLKPCLGLQGRESFVPGDPSLAGALALSAAVLPSSELLVRAPTVHAGRFGLMGALRRMGADIEPTGRREKYGEQYASLRVQYRKRLIGRKIAGDLLLTCLDEIPLLGVAAAFADGESIVRLPPLAAARAHIQLEALTANLKIAGVEVGIFEEGLVVRGREEPEAGAFDAQGNALLGLALMVLAAGCPGRSTIAGLENTVRTFPQAMEFFGGHAQTPEEESPHESA